jgi:sRNA-binding regulator protein Hfq
MDIFSNENLIELLPTVVILISAVIYYFGVRWGETKVEEYSVASHYFAGILFVIRYLLMPLFIILIIKYSIETYVSNFSDLSIIELKTYSLQAFVLYLLILVVEYIIHKIVHFSRNRFVEKRKSRDEFEAFEYPKINKYGQLLLLYFIPLLVTTIVYVFYELNVPFVIIIPSFIIAFLTFTNLAFCAGYCNTHYPEAVLYLKNGMVIDGIILKKGNYTYVLTKNKEYIINKDEIRYIEVNGNFKTLNYDYFSVVYKKLTSSFR